MNEMIQTEKLTKNFGTFTAVQAIDLTVKKGEIYGFLGLNGAGKTTTIRMLLGMIRPTSGNAYINGLKVMPNQLSLWEKVGYLVEVPYAYPELTVRENLDIYSKLRKIKDKNTTQNIMDKLKISQYENRKAGKLSLGNAQRLGLAKALIHQPDILILDEPTNGLDPAGIMEIRELLLNLSQNHGVTIFVSSHILGEISKIATRIGIIHDGHLIQELETHQVDQLRTKRLIVRAESNLIVGEILTQNQISWHSDEKDNIVLDSPTWVSQPEAISKLLAENKCYISHLSINEEDLESYFFNVISQKGDR